MQSCSSSVVEARPISLPGSCFWISLKSASQALSFQ